MIDASSINVPGSILLAGLLYAGVSAFALGPIVAERTIKKADWPRQCEGTLSAEIRRQAPTPPAKLNLSCNDIMGAMGPGMAQFCQQGGGALFDLMTIDPLAGQKEAARRRAAERLSRIAAQAPSRCSCAASVVQSNTVSWGLYAGSARTLGGPDDLAAELTAALQSPRCARLSTSLVSGE